MIAASRSELGGLIAAAAGESMQLTPYDMLFLQTICCAFHERGDWPTLRWLERELLAHEEIDVLELENRLQRVIYDPPYVMRSWDPDRKVSLTVSAINECQSLQLCPGLREDLDDFRLILDLCVGMYYDDFQPLQLSESELRNAEKSWSELRTRKVFLLIKQDSNIHELSKYNHNEQGMITDWTFVISGNIRNYRKVRTIEDYLAERAKLKPKLVSSGGPTNPGRDHTIWRDHTIYPVSHDTYSSQTNAEQTPPTPVSADNTSEYEYDVAVSFAGTERELAKQLAMLVQNAGFRVFYDEFYTAKLWGAELTVSLDEIYRKKSRRCVMFCSDEYVKRMWTNHERKSAVARMVEERGNEYLLPIKVETIDVPGIPPSISCLSLSQYSIDEIGAFLITKLRED